MWNFKEQGVIRIMNEELRGKDLAIEEIELELIDAGAQDIQKEKEGVTIITKVEDLQTVKKFLESKEIKTETAEIEYISLAYEPT